ncbi:hypothetical protein MKW98_032762 [Papaver atlanticum]|uniref:Uncharacterized protein n=1 Tax=Papaver atlanticum TaxID=357466 RepID=A0AAD4X6E9_9MAGN|nr:hypothetical protein MKW98_032762 [Papaver atlanticum]
MAGENHANQFSLSSALRLIVFSTAVSKCHRPNHCNLKSQYQLKAYPISEIYTSNIQVSQRMSKFLDEELEEHAIVLESGCS